MREMKRASRPAWLQWKALLIVLVGALLLTGCGTLDQEITFYEGEGWELSGRVTMPSELVAMAGGPGLIESELRSAFREKAPQAEMSLRTETKDEFVVFHVRAEGEGWESLNAVAFDGDASITMEDGKITISYSIPLMPGLTISSLTLRGGQIISSNADKETNGKAIWYNPTGIIEATFTAKGHANIGLIVLLVLLGLLATGGGVAVLARKQKSSAEGKAIAEVACPECGTPNSSADRFCQNCGTGLGPLTITCPKCAAQNPPEARFCSQCGAESSPAR